MADKTWIDQRPAGEWVLELQRPLTRFGWALKVGIKSPDGKFWIARAHEGGWQFTEHERGVDAPNTMFFDDFMLDQLRNLLQTTPTSSYEGDNTSHLKDAIATRDRLMVMVEKHWNAMHDPVIMVPRSEQVRGTT